MKTKKKPKPRKKSRLETANIRVDRYTTGLGISYNSYFHSGGWKFCCSRASVKKIAETLTGEIEHKSRPKKKFTNLCTFTFRGFQFWLSPEEAKILLGAINDVLPWYQGP